MTRTGQFFSRPFASITVDIAKIRDYCLSDTHPRWRHKARVFRSRLGLTVNDAELLRQALLHAARDSSRDLRPTVRDDYGQRYVLDVTMTTAVGTGTIRSSWIVPRGQTALRLTSCYLLPETS